MEDKMLELMEKMYIEFKDFRVDITEKIGGLDSKVGSLDTKFENLHKNVLRIENKLDNISSKVEKQDVEIRVVKGSK